MEDDVSFEFVEVEILEEKNYFIVIWDVLGHPNVSLGSEEINVVL